MMRALMNVWIPKLMMPVAANHFMAFTESLAAILHDILRIIHSCFPYLYCSPRFFPPFR